MKRKFKMPDGEVREIDFPEFKTPYNHDREFESDRTALFTPEESLTKQEFKDECDINIILERFMRTGEPPAMPMPEHFMDATQQPTYHEMQTRIAEANDNFYLLPPALRADFQNDPTRWADAVMNALATNDRGRLREIGIAAPDIVQPTPTPAAGSPAAALASGAPSAPNTATPVAEPPKAAPAAPGGPT